MLKYVNEDREYSKAIRELTVQADVYSFIEGRRIITGVRKAYIQLYDFVFKNWDRLGRPDGGQSNMHG